MSCIDYCSISSVDTTWWQAGLAHVVCILLHVASNPTLTVKNVSRTLQIKEKKAMEISCTSGNLTH